MGEQNGSSFMGSSSFDELFKSSLGPKDIISCVIKGEQVATYLLGTAMISDAANPGLKKKYTNGAGISDESLAGDGSTVTFDLANDNVVASTLRIHNATGERLSFSFSKGTGTAGVDQVTFEVAPTGTVYANYSTDVHLAGACVLMKAVTTTATSGNYTADGARDGSVKSEKVLDSAGALVDENFRNALPTMKFD